MKLAHFWLLPGLLIFASLVWPANVSQRTTGACSPPVTHVKGDVRIEIRCSGLDPDSLKLILKNVKALRNDLPQLTETVNKMRDELHQAITVRPLDTKQVEEIISLKHRVIFASSEDEAKRWAKELMESSAEKRKELKSLAVSGRELADRLLLRWKPIYEFFLKDVDNRISLLNKPEIMRDTDRRDADLLVVDDQPQTMGVRGARFNGGGPPGAGATISVILNQGQIHRGQIRKWPSLVLQEHVNGASYSPVYLSFEQQAILFQYSKENQQPNPLRKVTGEDPLADEEFRRALSTAIGNSFSFVYLNSVVSQ